MTLTNGQRVTLLKIDDALAMTHRYELEVRQLVAPELVAYQGSKNRLAVVRQRGKRKEFYLDLAADDILLDGWGLPFHADTEGNGVFSGNACYNLVGEPEAIRQCIEAKAVFPVGDDAKAKIIVCRADRTKCNEEGLELLYPNIGTHHAVVKADEGLAAGRMMSRNPTLPDRRGLTPAACLFPLPTPGRESQSARPDLLSHFVSTPEETFKQGQMGWVEMQKPLVL